MAADNYDFGDLILIRFLMRVLGDENLIARMEKPDDRIELADELRYQLDDEEKDILKGMDYGVLKQLHRDFGDTILGRIRGPKDKSRY